MDLRTTEWREAIVEIANVIKNTQLTERGLALLIADSCAVTMTQAIDVLRAISELDERYLKRED